MLRYPRRKAKDDPRFVVISLPYVRQRSVGSTVARRCGEPAQGAPAGAGLGSDELLRFWANQFRLLLTATAYILLPAPQWVGLPHPLRHRAGEPPAGAAAQGGPPGSSAPCEASCCICRGRLLARWLDHAATARLDDQALAQPALAPLSELIFLA